MKNKNKVTFILLLSSIIILLGGFTSKDNKEDNKMELVSYISFPKLKEKNKNTNYLANFVLEGKSTIENKILKIKEEVKILDEARKAEEARLEEERLVKEAEERVRLEAEEARIQEEQRIVVEPTGYAVGQFTVSHYAVGDGMTPSTVTANGTDVSSSIYTPEGYRIIAASSMLPMNSIVKITMANGSVIMAKVCDTGSAIVNNKIDLLVGSRSEALQLGITSCIIEIIR